VPLHDLTKKRAQHWCQHAAVRCAATATTDDDILDRVLLDPLAKRALALQSLERNYRNNVVAVGKRVEGLVDVEQILDDCLLLLRLLA
jgi:hypothetical protein